MGKSNLYTRTGDAGETSLVGGERVRKSSARLEAYGTLDEFSSFLGVVLSAPSCPEELKGQLLKIQNELFNLGAYLATAPAPGTTPSCGLTDADLSELEGWIDALDEQTPKIRAFVLPGGCELAAHAHVARTVCRRAERRILALTEEESVAAGVDFEETEDRDSPLSPTGTYVDPMLLRYINRLSDYLFIAARWLNFMAGVDEIVWQQKK